MRGWWCSRDQATRSKSRARRRVHEAELVDVLIKLCEKSGSTTSRVSDALARQRGGHVAISKSSIALALQRAVKAGAVKRSKGGSYRFKLNWARIDGKAKRKGQQLRKKRRKRRGRRRKKRRGKRRKRRRRRRSKRRRGRKRKRGRRRCSRRRRSRRRRRKRRRRRRKPKKKTSKHESIPPDPEPAPEPE